MAVVSGSIKLPGISVVMISIMTKKKKLERKSFMAFIKRNYPIPRQNQVTVFYGAQIKNNKTGL